MMKKIRKLILLVLCFLFVLLLPACGGNAESTVVVAGSTSVQPFVELLAERYEIIYQDRAVDVQGGGSSAGIQAARAGTADIGMSSRPLSESEIELWHMEIARDGLAIIAHPSNPVSNITVEQLLAVYTGDITNWSELGGNDARIHLIAREEGSGTRGAFEELVMGSFRITPRAIVQNTNGSVRQLVSNDRNAVGFVSLGLVDGTVKALSINGIAATIDNIDNETYELFRSFWFVSAEEPAGADRDFIDFVVSDEGRRILMLEGLVPPPEQR